MSSYVIKVKSTGEYFTGFDTNSFPYKEVPTFGEFNRGFVYNEQDAKNLFYGPLRHWKGNLEIVEIK